MSRLIDADKLIEDIEKLNRELFRDLEMADTEVIRLTNTAQIYIICESIIPRIKEQSTTFDVDKVVEQLEEEKMWYETHGVNMDMKKGIIGATCKAIKIVKAGGIDE